jgi:hypothetical protein
VANQGVSFTIDTIVVPLHGVAVTRSNVVAAFEFVLVACSGVGGTADLIEVS